MLNAVSYTHLLKYDVTAITIFSNEFRNMSYGYLWWIVNENVYAAIGNSGNVIAVSYTHLDVYKRQPLQSPAA